MKNNNEAIVYIVRHGETDWNVAQRIQGQTDTPLNKTGEEQAQLLGQALKDVHFDAVFSSDLMRAKKTAEIATLEKNIAVQTTELLRERNFGSLEGKNRDEFRTLDALRRNLETEQRMKYRLVPDMENDEEVAGRVITFLREIAVAYAGKTMLVFSHGGVMHMLLDHFGFGNETHGYITIENTAYIKVRADGVNFFIEGTKGITKT